MTSVSKRVVVVAFLALLFSTLRSVLARDVPIPVTAQVTSGPAPLTCLIGDSVFATLTITPNLKKHQDELPDATNVTYNWRITKAERKTTAAGSYVEVSSGYAATFTQSNTKNTSLEIVCSVEGFWKFTVTGSLDYTYDGKTFGGDDSRIVAPTFCKIVFDSVAAADDIGANSSGEEVYATNQGSGDVIVFLKTTPVSFNPPSSAVSWTGGNADPIDAVMRRRVSKGELAVSGQAVSASASGATAAKVRVYVFEAPPSASAATITVTRNRDDSFVLNSPDANPVTFGASNQVIACYGADKEYKVYYSSPAKKWKFVFSKVSYTATWGINSQERADITDANVSSNPFPVGRGLDAGTSESVKKGLAKNDLTPFSNGTVTMGSYWSSPLTIRHETFHLDDFENNYYKPRMADAETTIEATEVDVTVSNLAPDSVLNDKKSSFDDIIATKTGNAVSGYMYNLGNEARAYADGKDAYQALADSITP